MPIKEEVLNVFRQMVEEEGDNQAKAAAKLGVNQVTFWGWLSGSRNIGSDAVWRALDAAGAHVVHGNDKFTDETVTEHELRAQLSAVKLDLAAARERAAVYKKMVDKLMGRDANKDAREEPEKFRSAE